MSLTTTSDGMLRMHVHSCLRLHIETEETTRTEAPSLTEEDELLVRSGENDDEDTEILLPSTTADYTAEGEGTSHSTSSGSISSRVIPSSRVTPSGSGRVTPSDNVSPRSSGGVTPSTSSTATSSRRETLTTRKRGEGSRQLSSGCGAGTWQ